MIQGAGVYEEGNRKKKKIPLTEYDEKNLEDIPFYKKIIEPTYYSIFDRDNNRSILLPPKITLDLDNDPRLKYASKKERLPRLYSALEKYNIFVHMGQRKLFLSEIQHLSAKLQKDEPAIVVYSGSAPTNKAWAEHLLFPNVKFLFVDPNMFNIFFNEERESHYDRPNENGIIYYRNSKKNYNRDYRIIHPSIRYFDGEKEIIIDDKYSNSAPSDDKVDAHDERLIKHFYESDHYIYIYMRKVLY